MKFCTTLKSNNGNKESNFERCVTATSLFVAQRKDNYFLLFSFGKSQEDRIILVMIIIQGRSQSSETALYSQFYCRIYFSCVSSFFSFVQLFRLERTCNTTSNNQGAANASHFTPPFFFFLVSLTSL